MNSSTTAMQAALINANLGRPMSQIERIWLCVKDMQPVDYIAVVKRTGIPERSVSSLLSQLEDRGMCHSRGAKGAGPNGRKKEYMTDMLSYKMLPKPKADKKTKRPNVQAAQAPAPTIVVAQEPAGQQGYPSNCKPVNVIDLEQLTLAQLREHYRVLHGLFGEKK